MNISSKLKCQLSFNWLLNLIEVCATQSQTMIIVDSCLYKWRCHCLWEWGFWWRSQYLASNFTPTVFLRSSDETEIQFYVFWIIVFVWTSYENPDAYMYGLDRSLSLIDSVVFSSGSSSNFWKGEHFGLYLARDSNQGNKWEGVPAIFVDFCIIKKKSEKNCGILPRTWTPLPHPHN